MKILTRNGPLRRRSLKRKEVLGCRFSLISHSMRSATTLRAAWTRSCKHSGKVSVWGKVKILEIVCFIKKCKRGTVVSTEDYHYSLFLQIEILIYFSNDIQKMDSTLKLLKTVIHNQITKVSF